MTMARQDANIESIERNFKEPVYLILALCVYVLPSASNWKK